MQESPPAKYKILRDELIRAVRSGEFAAGQRLPSERELAARFGVSHMTARQAVTDLVDYELLERRSRSGIYVHENSREKLSTTTLNLICFASDDSTTTQFLKFGNLYAQKRGWRVRMTRSHEGYERPIVRSVQAGEPSFIFLDLPGLSKHLREAMIHANGRAIMIGNRMDDLGVPSVMADDRLAIRMAVSHLQAAGHENIALLYYWAEHPVISVQIDEWKKCLAPKTSPSLLEKLLIEVEQKDFHSGAEAGYDAVAQYLQRPDAEATAILCLDDTIAMGAIAACRDRGLKVPEDMSFVCAMDSDIMHFSNPGVTVIDVGIENHIQFALELFDAALAGKLPDDDRLRLVQPKLVKRASVCKRAVT